jgi:hypothetical protein
LRLALDAVGNVAGEAAFGTNEHYLGHAPGRVLSTLTITGYDPFRS